MCTRITKLVTLKKPKIGYVIRKKDNKGNLYSLMDEVLMGVVGDKVIDPIYNRNYFKVTWLIHEGALHVLTNKRYAIQSLKKDGWACSTKCNKFISIIQIEIPAREKIGIGINYGVSKTLDFKPAIVCRTYKMVKEIYCK